MYDAWDCLHSSCLCTFPASLEDGSVSRSERSRSERSQDVLGGEFSMAPAAEVTGPLDVAVSMPGLPAMGQTRLGFTHVHRWGCTPGTKEKEKCQPTGPARGQFLHAAVQRQPGKL